MDDSSPDDEPRSDTDHSSRTGTELPAGSGVARLLELGEVFEALNHPRRRYLLYTLVNGNAETSLSELATKIASWEHETLEADVTPDERRDIEISLYHSHVPLLVDLDILDYDEQEDVIGRGENIEQVQAVLAGAGAELDARQEDHARRDDE